MFKFVNDSIAIRYAIRDVSSPGPPDVMAYTKSKEVKRHNVKGMHKVSTFRVISGRVILLKL